MPFLIPAIGNLSWFYADYSCTDIAFCMIVILAVICLTFEFICHLQVMYVSLVCDAFDTCL